jgi:hypothetical protein
VAQLVCGVAQMVVCQLAVRQAEFGSRLGTPWGLLLLSREAMKIQEDRPRQLTIIKPTQPGINRNK